MAVFLALPQILQSTSTRVTLISASYPPATALARVPPVEFRL